jgi:CheY-like chemotaxis protein
MSERKRVLVADDDPGLRLLALEVLTEMGHEVVVATDGLEAWRQLEAGRFDLILVDEAMPGLAGTEVVARARSGGTRTPAVLWSGHAMLSVRERSELGIVAVLRKPVRIERLAQTLHAALRQDEP